MKTKRFISLLLLTVYLLAAGGPAMASLSCRCVAPKAHTHHLCTCHCLHADAAAAARTDLSAPCCGHHHSTDVELYTGISSDNERQDRTQAVDLWAALTPDAPAAICPPTHGERIVLRQTLLPRKAASRGVGLRAPPVLV